GLSALGERAAAVIAERPAGPEGPPAPVVLTPHDGEAKRLAGRPPDPDRFAYVRDLAARVGCVVLLKGSTTLIADPDGTVLATTTGGPYLATAGTGDVLTGTLVALLAQHLPPQRAAAAASFLHGRAGALAWPRGLVASDLVRHLPAALADLSE
ncbi:MAG: putative carbohydrate kinase, partial [Acidimicrobiales bacterium]|nr:putative carbohydrate kinase [Acidimicrobiales bacterium]